MIEFHDSNCKHWHLIVRHIPAIFDRSHLACTTPLSFSVVDSIIELLITVCKLWYYASSKDPFILPKINFFDYRHEGLLVLILKHLQTKQMTFSADLLKTNLHK